MLKVKVNVECKYPTLLIALYVLECGALCRQQALCRDSVKIFETSRALPAGKHSQLRVGWTIRVARIKPKKIPLGSGSNSAITIIGCIKVQLKTPIQEDTTR